MHCNGLIWGTAHTGNFMTGPEPEDELIAFDFPYALCSARDMHNTSYARFDLWKMARDLQKLCRLDKPLVDLLYITYAKEMDLHAEQLRLQLEKRVARDRFFRDRARLRTLQSFRIRPF